MKEKYVFLCCKKTFIMRKYPIFMLFALLVLSCDKNDNFEKEVNNFFELQILDFPSLEEMEKKINEINVLKGQKESNTLEKLLLRNNITEPILDHLSKRNESKKEITYDGIEGDLEFYHRERLNNIYELRKELGFTSIQSIADEINSLKLLDPKKAEELYYNNSNLLEKSKFEVYSIYGDEISDVLNYEGKVEIDNKLLKLDINNEYKNKIKYDGNQEESKSSQSISALVTNDSAVLAIKFGVFIVNWEVGKRRDRNNPLYRYAYYTKLAGFVITPENQYVNYPITINVGAPSDCKFKRTSGQNVFVSFMNTGTSTSFFNHYSSSRSFYLDEVRIASSTFTVVANGQTHTISSSSFSKKYDGDGGPIYD